MLRSENYRERMLIRLFGGIIACVGILLVALILSATPAFEKAICYMVLSAVFLGVLLVVWWNFFVLPKIREMEIGENPDEPADFLDRL